MGDLITTVLAVPGAINDSIQLHEAIKKKKEGLKTLDNDAFRNYLEEDIYIPIDITDSRSKDSTEKHPFFNYFTQMLKSKQIDSKYICLMGDIGSGKTDALAHLYKSYKLKSSMPPRIGLYTMNVGYKELWRKIDDTIPKAERGKTILLLDALDECMEARDSLVNTDVNNPRIFMQKLAQDTRDFAWVVVSCRQQFFQREEFNPDPTGQRIGNPSGSDPFQHWHILNISPFSDSQVWDYLIKRLGVPSNDPQNEEARRIVFSCKEVFLRPLILKYIDIILDVYSNRMETLTSKEVYDTIIWELAKRNEDGNDVKARSLLDTSVSMAAYMYKNRLNRLDDEHYKTMCSEYKIDDPDNLLRVKSFLKNDGDAFRFTHQSFYEHLLAYHFFLHPNEIGSLLGLLNSTLKTYDEVVHSYFYPEKATELSQQMEIESVQLPIMAGGLVMIGKGLSDLCHYKDAERYFQFALSIFQDLEKNIDGVFIGDVAATLNNLAVLHKATNRHDVAEKEFDEALEYFLKLAGSNPDAYTDYVAATLNNLAVLHADTNRYDEAEKEYNEALEIRRKLAEHNPEAYLPDVVGTLINIGNHHRATNRLDEAGKEFSEALEYCHKFADSKRDEYLPYMAKAIDSIGLLHRVTSHHDESEKEYNEALKIFQKLANSNPDAYLPDLARTLTNLALLYANNNRDGEAEYLFNEALGYYRNLAESNWDTYIPNVAKTLKHIALLYSAQGRLDEAEVAAQESLEKYQIMAEKSHATFDNDVENAIELLDKIMSANQ